MMDPLKYTALSHIHLDLSEVRISHTSNKCRMELQTTVWESWGAVWTHNIGNSE